MADNPSDSRDRFDFYSNEYAQALQAYTAIENQAATLALMGATDELRGFIDRFLAMAERTRDLARDENEANFAEWFEELILKAQKLRTALPNR